MSPDNRVTWLEQALLKRKLLDESKLAEVREFQDQRKIKFFSALTAGGFVDDRTLAKVTSEELKVPLATAEELAHPDPKALKQIPQEKARKDAVMPLKIEGNTLIIALTDPFDIFMQEDIHFLTGMRIKPCVAAKTDILQALEAAYPPPRTAPPIHPEPESRLEVIPPFPPSDLVDDGEKDDQDDIARLMEEPAAESGVADDVGLYIRMSEALLAQAIKERATELHLDPYPDRVSLRLRVDGVLREGTAPPKSAMKPLLARFKIMSVCDISERRRPQEGFLTVRFDGRLIRLRVATMPTAEGERLTVTILDVKDSPAKLDELGLEKRQIDDLLEAARGGHGLILVGGRRASGKTTTLYALLETMKSADKNLMTLESLFLRKLDGVSQSFISPKSGMGYAEGLRALASQSPDVLLVGEIDGGETAGLCLQAAMAHPLLSSLFASDAATILERFLDMGIAAWRLQGGIRVVAAQRLVRKLCEKCKTGYKPAENDPHLRQCQGEMHLPDGLAPKKWTWFKAIGCKECGGTGFYGRTAVAEVFPVTDDVQRVLAGKCDEFQILRDALLKTGRWDMRSDAWLKVIRGLTTPEEAFGLSS